MEHIGPGPIDPSLLTLQAEHLSEIVWNSVDDTTTSFRSRHNFWAKLPAEPVLQVIRNTAFRHIVDITSMDINNHLITALVERWRPETHTFHLPCGECTITLEDVVHLLGLPVDGEALIGSTSLNWEEECLESLGAVPEGREISGQRILLTWLDSTFEHLPDDADDVVIHQYARAFILRIIGGFLMPDTSGNRVNLMYLPFLQDLGETSQYSWGSAVLAFLYRSLCRGALIRRQVDMGGCLLLLQCWAYERMDVLAPRMRERNIQFFPRVVRWSHENVSNVNHGYAVSVFRAMLDRLRLDQFKWMPYAGVNSIHVPDICRARVPLIAFSLVEWHHADRVMRQFGMDQAIPMPPMDMQKMHKIDLRGKNDYNWPQRHAKWVQLWNRRTFYVCTAPANVQPLYQYSDYMQWYLARTRKYISKDGAYSCGTLDFLKKIRDELTPSSQYSNPMHIINNVYGEVNEMIAAFTNLMPASFSTDVIDAPPTQQFRMPPGFEEEQPQAYSYPRAPTPPPPTTRPFGLDDFAPTGEYPLAHNQFGATSSTPPSAFYQYPSSSHHPSSSYHPSASYQPAPSYHPSSSCYRPQMPTQMEEDDDEEEEEEPQPPLVRGRRRQPPQGNEGRTQRSRRPWF